VENTKYKLGNTLYEQSFFFVDHAFIISQDMQNRIKEYQFCKKFNCPPYPSISQTPADIIDDFFIIDEEYNNCMEKSREKANA